MWGKKKDRDGKSEQYRDRGGTDGEVDKDEKIAREQD